uniref:Uncharacterized protein orf622 n=1 Tax=Desmarestia viridis TaxID=62313 RepID=Q2TUF1_9PHAE|nr:hypothetical protein DevioMp23 [Desmarestia viridis]AAS79045.1 hypothetical protein [Desmarestia viridis]
MKSAKNHSKNDLSILYDSCLVFKKYCQLNLWSEEFGEYDKVKHCGTHLYRYISAVTQVRILQCFSPAFLAILRTSPSFTKFMKSGFIKYIDFHFLLFFQYNSFHYSNDSFEEIETFVEEYFEKYSRKVFEEDLLKCLIRSINDIVPQSLQGFMAHRLTFFYKQTSGSNRLLSNSVWSENDILKSREFCSFGSLENKDVNKDFYLFFSSNALISSLVITEVFFNSFFELGNKKYKSLYVKIDPLDIAFTDFLNIVLSDTIYGWGLFFGGYNKNKITPIIFMESFFDKTSYIHNYFYKFDNIEYHSEIIYMISNGYEWCFYVFLDVTSKPRNIPFPFRQNSQISNKSIHTLLEFFVDPFLIEENDIDSPRHKNNILKGDFKSCSLGISSSNFDTLLKIFDDSFNQYSNKRQITFLETSVTVSTKSSGLGSSIENTFLYSDRGLLYIFVNFNKRIRYLDVIPQRFSEEEIFCFINDFNDTFPGCKEIFIETFEDTCLAFEELPIDILKKLLIKTYDYRPIIDKQFVFISFYCLENTVNEWGLYYLEYANVPKKLGKDYTSDPTFFFSKNSIIYRYFYANSKKVSGWESSYLINCGFMWGIHDCNLKITFDKLLEIRPNKVLPVGG